MRVRLTGSSFGYIDARRKGKFLSHDPIVYPDGYKSYAGWFSGKTIDPSGRQGMSSKLCFSYLGRVVKGCTGIGILDNCYHDGTGEMYYEDDAGELMRATQDVREEFLTRFLGASGQCDGKGQKTVIYGPKDVFSYLGRQITLGGPGTWWISTPHSITVSGTVTYTCELTTVCGVECERTVKILHSDLHWNLRDEIDANPNWEDDNVIKYCAEQGVNIIGDGLLDAEYYISIDLHQTGGNGRPITIRTRGLEICK